MGCWGDAFPESPESESQIITPKPPDEGGFFMPKKEDNR